MKILYIITSLGMGGAETQVCSLADNMASLGHQVTIIYLVGKQVVSPSHRSVDVIGIDLTKNPLSFISKVYKLIHLIKTIKPDVVHSHMVHANLITRICRLVVYMPKLISSAHNSNEGGRLRMLGYRITHNLANLTTNVGVMSVKRFEDVGAAPKGGLVSMINGIDINKFNPNHNNDTNLDLHFLRTKKIFVAIGRNQTQKDYGNLLRSISMVNTSVDFHVLIVGLDTELLSSIVNELNLNNKVSLLGMRSDVHLILSMADALIVSSAWEGLPIVIGEAMASGCNVITTDAGGCCEWLTKYEKAVPIRDSVALAKAIELKLEQSDGEWSEISQANRQYIVDNFSISSVVNQWLEYYKDIK
ncbi:TPA: glycosyltransferase [Photobacterium damselae]